MHYAPWLRRAGWLTAIGIALLAGRSLSADDAAAAGEQPPAAKEGEPAEAPKPARVDAKQAQQGKELPGRVLIPKYRLALAFAPVPAALNERLGLKGEGLLIERVGLAGPAEKAGVKRNDILLAIGDKRVKKYGDAVEGLNASEGKEISLTLVRDGKTITVSVVPAKHRLGDEKVRVP